MTRLVPLLFLVIVSGCQCDADLVPYCADGTACWPSASGLVTGDDIPSVAHRGQCFVGNLQCDADGTGVCIGAVAPTEEECDAVDNDCDGLVDEGLFVSALDETNPCTLEGLCALAVYECQAGEWVCSPLFGPAPEQCNGRDDDCDGKIDEDLTSYSYPEEAFPGTVGIGECRPGVGSCVDGVAITSDPVVPHPEECNGRDDDCDGLVDEGDSEAPVALAYVVDMSGSMNQLADPVLDSICDLSAYASNVSVSLMIVAALDSESPFIELETDFTDSITACAQGRSVPWGGGVEYVYEAVAEAAELSWPADVAPEDRYVVLASDEPYAQRYEDDRQRAEAACVEVPFQVIALGLWENASDAEALVQTCTGINLSLSLVSSEISRRIAAFTGLGRGACP